MSGIEEKAKTTRQIIDKCVGTNKWKLDYEITGSNAPDLTEKWVRLEDAQQEIDRLIEQRNIESGIVDRMQRERGEQKQTCEEMRSKLKFLDYEQYHGDLKQSLNPTLREINQLITELLK